MGNTVQMLDHSLGRRNSWQFLASQNKCDSRNTKGKPREAHLISARKSAGRAEHRKQVQMTERVEIFSYERMQQQQRQKE